MTNCKVCNGEAKQKCSGCLLVFYCSKNCQISDWRSGHKNDCKPFEVDEVEHGGESSECLKGQIFLFR